MSNKREIIVGIYKITNLINGKAYIGQSVDIQRRWNKHRSASFNPKAKEYNSVVCCAIRMYGLDNFDFSILERCQQEKLNEREEYWIKHYDTYHDGYNQTWGGENGRKDPDEKTLGIMQDLKSTIMTHKAIADKWGVSRDTVDWINTGRMWFQDDIDYPIRKRTKKEPNKCIICGKPIGRKAVRCKECNVKEKSTIISRIRSKTKSQSCNRATVRPSKEELKHLILRNSMCQVAEKFGVTDNAVRKWCRSYDLPYKKEDIMVRKKELGVDEYHTNITNDVGKKMVIQLDEQLNVLNKYPSIVEAAQNIIADGKSNGSEKSVASRISKCCHGKYKTSYGYVWKLAEDLNAA